MKSKIFNYSISLLLCLLLAAPTLQAQNPTYDYKAQLNKRNKQKSARKTKEKKQPEVVYPFYNGLSVGVDLWGLGGKVFGSDFVSGEVSVDANLKNRYFPVVEIGFGGTDSWNDFGIHYKSSAPYFRIGMDYNALFSKAHGHMLLVGLRYAATSFKYDIMSPALDDPIYGGSFGNPNLTDPIWGDGKPFNRKGMKGSMQWAELCVGIRAHIYKSFYMGWALRYRFKISGSTDKYGDPWYVPGFGEYGDSKLGVTYTLTYRLPYKSGKKKAQQIIDGKIK